MSKVTLEELIEFTKDYAKHGTHPKPKLWFNLNHVDKKKYNSWFFDEKDLINGFIFIPYRDVDQFINPNQCYALLLNHEETYPLKSWEKTGQVYDMGSHVGKGFSKDATLEKEVQVLDEHLKEFGVHGKTSEDNYTYEEHQQICEGFMTAEEAKKELIGKAMTDEVKQDMCTNIWGVRTLPDDYQKRLEKVQERLDAVGYNKTILESLEELGVPELLPAYSREIREYAISIDVMFSSGELYTSPEPEGEDWLKLEGIFDSHTYNGSYLTFFNKKHPNLSICLWAPEALKETSPEALAALHERDSDVETKPLTEIKLYCRPKPTLIYPECPSLNPIQGNWATFAKEVKWPEPSMLRDYCPSRNETHDIWPTRHAPALVSVD